MIAAFLLFVATINQATQANVPAEERLILMDFFTATGGERWLKRDGWGSSTPVCDWYGVWCDYIDGDITRPVIAGLTLASNNLEGSIPASLVRLKHLRSLQLSGNHLSGVFPEALLERWDRHQFEFNGSGNVFSNLVVQSTIDYSASGVRCSEREDLNYRVEFDEHKANAIFQSVRCEAGGYRNTYCLIREGEPPSLSRFSRGLKALGFIKFRNKYDYPFSSTCSPSAKVRQIPAIK